MTVKTFGIFILATSSLFAQGSNTIFQNLLTNSVTVGALPPVRNIGQTFHNVTLKSADLTAGSCSGFGVDSWIVKLEASYDNVNYFQIGVSVQSVIANPNGPGTTQLAAAGAYPYVRLNYVSGPINDCSLTASYSGTISGAVNSTVPFTASSDGTFNYFTNLYAPGTSNNIFNCPGVPGVKRTMVFYSLFLNSADVDAVTMTVIDATTSGTLFANTFSMAAGGTVNLAPANRPYIVSVVSGAGHTSQLNIDVSAETAILMQIRCE